MLIVYYTMDDKIILKIKFLFVSYIILCVIGAILNNLYIIGCGLITFILLIVEFILIKNKNKNNGR